MIREIINIDENLCNGCGECVPSCHEGALKVIDGKVRLVSELACDGLGACIGQCPQGAISIIKREALPYDETEVIKKLVKQGRNTVVAHLKHLREHNQDIYHTEAVEYLRDHYTELNFKVDDLLAEFSFSSHNLHIECPGSVEKTIRPFSVTRDISGPVGSELAHWPVQLHLINPAAAFFKASDFLLAADCVAYALGNFHGKYLRGKTLAIACPKLDQGKEIYIDKIKKLITEAEIKSLHIMIMQVPCCSGLLKLADLALKESNRKIPVRVTIVGTNGTILQEKELN